MSTTDCKHAYAVAEGLLNRQFDATHPTDYFGLGSGRFFLNLKMERVWQRDYANYAEAKLDICSSRRLFIY